MNRFSFMLNIYLIFQGKIKDLHENDGFYQRLTAIDAQFPGTCVLLHKRGVLPPEIASLWSSETLLSIAKQLLGPDIAGHPVWNLRTKVPNQEQVTVPWHQDTACKTFYLILIISLIIFRFEQRMLECSSSNSMDSIIRCK